MFLIIKDYDQMQHYVKMLEVPTWRAVHLHKAVGMVSDT